MRSQKKKFYSGRQTEKKIPCLSVCVCVCVCVCSIPFINHVNFQPLTRPPNLLKSWVVFIPELGELVIPDAVEILRQVHQGTIPSQEVPVPILIYEEAEPSVPPIRFPIGNFSVEAVVVRHRCAVDCVDEFNKDAEVHSGLSHSWVY